ncbi:MAG: TauD/TfdA family dioxygenase [Thermoanaerobaculia bacterium]
MLPEIEVGLGLKAAVDRLAAGFGSIEEAEMLALQSDIAAPLRADSAWLMFSDAVTSFIDQRGYAVVRGLEADDGRSLLILGTVFRGSFDTYKPGRIVKRFRMSPWTTELSHTTRAGDFHTDGNVSENPPLGTAMQCEREDPGAPEYAEQRVAFLPDLLARLRSGDESDATALRFLTEEEIAMTHERASTVWRGRLVQNGNIRYHPHTLRTADARLNVARPDLDSIIATIHRAARDASVPFHTAPGDTVLVSNRTALHYRGACSVRFIRFPTEFESRSLYVLHVKEPVT